MNNKGLLRLRAIESNATIVGLTSKDEQISMLFDINEKANITKAYSNDNKLYKGEEYILL